MEGSSVGGGGGGVDVGERGEGGGATFYQTVNHASLLRGGKINNV